MDILLINAPSPYPTIFESHRLQGLPPLGLGYIATYINQYGFTAQILDFNIPDVNVNTVLSCLINQKPKLVGISTSTETYKNGIKLAKVIKEYCEDIIVIMGGYHVTFQDNDALDSGYVDLVIRGEGEVTFYELCEYYLRGNGSLSKIDGITYKDGTLIKKNQDRDFIKNLDELPFPDRKLFDLERYSVPSSISTSRGCPGQCIFCAASALSGGRYRVRSAENIIQEFKYLKSLGYNMIHIIDDTMTANVKRLNQFIDLMIKEKIDMNWYCESRIDIMTKDLLYRMKLAGNIFIQFGVEAGNQEMLDCLKKRITIEQIRNVFNWCKELGIKTATCFIIGQPFETQNSIKDSVDLALELQKMGAKVVFSIATPYPGTDMYKNTEKYNINIEDKDTDNYNTYLPIFSISNMSCAEIQESFFDAYYSLFKDIQRVD